MSYNVTRTTILFNDNWRIPEDNLDSLEPYNGRRSGSSVKFSLEDIGESTQIIGEPIEGGYKITDVHYSGEGTGNDYEDWLGVLAATMGQALLLTVWEGGDDIVLLAVRDGVIRKISLADLIGRDIVTFYQVWDNGERT